MENEAKTEKDIKQLLSGCLPLLIKFFHLEGNMPDDINGILTTILKGLNIDEFLNEFEEYKPEMFINGAGSIYQLLLAIGIGKQIVIVDKDNKISKIFDPKKGLLTVIDAESENKSDDAIYVCVIFGHMMKLEQVDNDTNKASINTEKENILSVINKKISMNKKVFSATKQVIKDAYEHFISDDRSKCNGDEFPQLHAAYDAINPQKREDTESQETNRKEDSDKQIAKLMSKALVEIAILRPLYWMDYSKNLTHHFLLLEVSKVINNCVEFLNQMNQKICDINTSSKAEIIQEKELGELKEKLIEYWKIIMEKMGNALKKSSDLEDFFVE